MQTQITFLARVLVTDNVTMTLQVRFHTWRAINHRLLVITITATTTRYMSYSLTFYDSSTMPMYWSCQ